MRSFLEKILAALLLAFMLSNPLAAQEKDSLITLKLTDVRFEDLLKQLTEHSGMGFSYNPLKVPVDTLVSVSFTSSSLNDILDSLVPFGISYKILDDHIVLKKSRRAVTKNRQIRERFTISGYIRDALSGEVLIGATLGDPLKGVGIASNAFGFYSLTLDAGVYKLESSYIGYQQSNMHIELQENRSLDLYLSPHPEQIEEVTVTENSSERIVESISSGKMEIRSASINKIPGMLGESDVLKSIQSLPGVNFYSDGSTIFHVRGGNRDQNLILIDDAPIYNPAHMLGMFSAFTPESINSISIYRGDMPALYGGRLSSVIDIRLKDGNSNSLVFSGSTGPIATTLNLEGPMFKDRSSFYISARRSHLKWILDINTATVDKLHFSDFNLKYNFRINRKNRILLSYYSGLDMFRNNGGSSSHGISWENNAGNLRWNHVFNEKLFINTGIIVSNYDYNLFTNWEDRERWNTGIGLLALKSDFSYYRSTSSTYKAGISLATHFYSPGNYYIGVYAQPVTRGVSAREARESSLYFSNENSIGSRFKLRYGLRLTAWQNSGRATEYIYNDANFPVDTISYPDNKVYNTFTSLEPRLSIQYKIRSGSTAKISWTRNSQFEFLVSNSLSPFTSLEAWLPASPNILPMKANQFTAGLTFRAAEEKIIFSTELFYKHMNNYMDYADHASMLFNPHIETEIRYGKGKSYGGELLVKKPEGRLNGWLSYSYSRTILTIPGINKGKDYPSVYDRPHTFNIYLNYQALPGVNLSATWIYSTGSPITTPTGFYYYNGYQVPFYDKRNNDRLPDYHRLDLSSEFRLNKPGAKYKHSLGISVMNFYGRKNPFSINFNKILNDYGKLRVPSDHYESPEIRSSMMYIFGILPSITYKFEF